MANSPTADDRTRLFSEAVSQAIRLHEAVLRSDPEPVLAAARAIERALAQGGKVLVFGNGGSAADAQHMAAELVGRFARERHALSAIALTPDASVVTAIGNDYGFEHVFARQVEALGRPGDAAVGISTSGESPNILAAFAAAEQQGLTRIALTGREGGALGRMADIHINVPHASTPRIQEVHRTLLHVICELVERALTPSS